MQFKKSLHMVSAKIKLEASTILIYREIHQ